MTTETGNRSNAEEVVTEDVEIKVPVGTAAIVSVPEGLALGFNRDDNAALEDISWPSGVDHHYGLGFFQVIVTDINAVDTSTTPTPCSTVRA